MLILRRFGLRQGLFWSIFFVLMAGVGWWNLSLLMWVWGGVASFLGLLWLMARVGRVYLGEARVPPRVDRVPMEDGWSLAMANYPAKGDRRGVVVTCHGFNANRNNMDLSEDFSLVGFLQEQGFEVWNVDLRGYGESRPLSREQGGPVEPFWSFDDHAQKDVPAILAHVTKASEVPSVHWVGHSMGGLVMYAYLGLHSEETRLASLCTLGSPAGLAPSLPNRLLAWVAPLLFAASPIFPLRWLARGGALLFPRVPINFGFSYPPNMNAYIFRRGLFVMTEDFNERITAVFLEMLRSGRFVSADGMEDYRANLAKVDIPFCCIAGGGDKLAPPTQVRLGFDAMGSSCKEFHILDRKHGASLDYCHNGLLFAKTVKQEMYPLLLGWLEKRLSS